MFYVKERMYGDCPACNGKGTWKERTRSGNKKTVECQQCAGTGNVFIREEYREATIEERIEKLEEIVERLESFYLEKQAR